jgi:hypothetical protein
MVNIGLIGDEGVGKTSILRSFLRSVEEGVKQEDQNNPNIFLINQNLTGEDKVKHRTILPNRVLFREGNNNERHYIFDPGGGITSPIVKMGMITILRVSSRIIAVFSLGRDLSSQLEYFKGLKYLKSRNYYVCLSKFDLLEGSNLEKKEIIEEIIQKITVFFKLYTKNAENEPIEINGFYITSQSFPESITKMILDVLHLSHETLNS